MEEEFSFPVLVFSCGSVSFPMPVRPISAYALSLPFRARQSLHSLQRFAWSSSRWQIATAVFSKDPRRSSSLYKNQNATTIGNPTWEMSCAQSMVRPAQPYPRSG